MTVVGKYSSKNAEGIKEEKNEYRAYMGRKINRLAK